MTDKEKIKFLARMIYEFMDKNPAILDWQPEDGWDSYIYHPSLGDMNKLEEIINGE